MPINTKTPMIQHVCVKMSRFQMRANYGSSRTLPHSNLIYDTGEETMGFKFEAVYKICKITSTMSMAEYAKLKSNDTSAFMGLEAYLFESSSVGYKRRTEQKNAQRGAVILEQFRQLKLGVEDPDALANVSKTWSGESRERAHIIGLLHIADES